MPTVKKRITITVDDEIYKALELLSQRKQKSVSETSLDLLEKAIEIEEDFHFHAKQMNDYLPPKNASLTTKPGSNGHKPSREIYEGS